MIDIITDTLVDALKLLPFLYLTYLLIEWLEHCAESRTLEIIHRAGKFGPLLGGPLGALPQCGFSAATANLYAGGIITRGTLIAVFLSTSDEMLPILISNQVDILLIVKILVTKAVIGILAGLLTDLIEKLLHRNNPHRPEDLCAGGDCHCDKENIFLSALRHTLHIFFFLLLISLLLNTAVAWAGPERLATFILNRPVVGELLAGLIGFIPNCAASVVLTQLYLAGGMGIGAMLSGLLVGAGVGILVLFRVNRNLRDNLRTVALLYFFGVAFGLLASVLPIF